MATQIVDKKYILAAYCEASQTLDHEDACAQVAALCGQTADVVAGVVREEATV